MRKVPLPTVTVKATKAKSTPRRPQARRKAAGPPQWSPPALAAAVAIRPEPVARKPAAPARPAKARSAPRRPKAAPAKARRARSRHAKPRAMSLADRWPARGAWMGGLALVFASPTPLLAAMPLAFEAKATMAAATVLVLCLAGFGLTSRWLRERRSRIQAAWLWFTAAFAATLALAGIGKWGWLVYTTGAACLALGLCAFVWMERGRPGAFRPRGVGLLHGVLGVPVAYLPVLAIWLLGSF